jgi:hypothetical protein
MRPVARPVSAEAAPYGSSWEHLVDELERLDQLIRVEVLKQRPRRTENPLDPFSGLVISDEEVAGLLADAASDAGEGAQALAALDIKIQSRKQASLTAGGYLSLPQLGRLFGLTEFEERCLVVCMAPELERKYEKLYGYIQDDVTRRRPTVDLVLSLLCRGAAERLSARICFDSRSPLLRFRLLQCGDGTGDQTPLLSRPLKLDDRTLDFLLGIGRFDARLDLVASLVSPGAGHAQIPRLQESRTRAVELIKSQLGQRNIILHLAGPDGAGREALATAICHDLGLPMIVADLSKMSAQSVAFEELIWLAGREAVMQPAALCLRGLDALLADTEKLRSRMDALSGAVTTFSRLTFLIGKLPWKPEPEFGQSIAVRIEVPVPEPEARRDLWQSILAAQTGPTGAGDLDEVLDDIAVRFKFTPGQVKQAIRAAQNLARWRSPDARMTAGDLYAACRGQCGMKLGALARKVDPKHRWEDIVLPPDQLEQLHEICDQVKHHHTVYGKWGFGRKLSLGRGVTALFSGPPGTGKTMAAEVISNELQLDLYKIDLSQIVSKYIGETEKNLDKVFEAAEASNAILFFDEADALFGKRSEVKDAHDRYANIEIGYLLQKMEEYEGIAILATNLRQNMDEAFVRRLGVIVEFPFPDEEYRRRIWEVVFPAEAPLGDDVDFGVLARAVKLAGGNIKNISLAAAFYAARDGGVISRSHLNRAARREHQKLGRTWSEFELDTQGAFAS